MFSSGRLLLAVLVVAFPLRVQAEDRQDHDPAALRAAARELARQVEYLQEDIIAEVTVQKERTLYRKADAVLAAINHFQQTAKPAVTPANLFKSFDELEGKINDLLTDVRALGTGQRTLQRSADRLEAADEHLYAALAGLDASGGRSKVLLVRQSRALAVAARQLDKTAQYALAGSQDQGVLPGELHKLAEAAERFQKDVNSGASQEQLRRDFAAVNRSWENAVKGLEKLKSTDNTYLLRTAERVDRLHDRLFRILGVSGERSRLTIQT